MARIFDPVFVEKHDFYHARYGLGAVVVAVPKDPDPETAEKRRSRAPHAARLFAERNDGSTPVFDPVLAIEEQSGVVRMTLEFERRSPTNPKYVLASATIERIVPIGRVTVEIVHASERQGKRHGGH